MRKWIPTLIVSFSFHNLHIQWFIIWIYFLLFHYSEKIVLNSTSYTWIGVHTIIRSDIVSFNEMKGKKSLTFFCLNTLFCTGLKSVQILISARWKRKTSPSVWQLIYDWMLQRSQLKWEWIHRHSLWSADFRMRGCAFPTDTSTTKNWIYLYQLLKVTENAYNLCNYIYPVQNRRATRGRALLCERHILYPYLWKITVKSRLEQVIIIAIGETFNLETVPQSKRFVGSICSSEI